MPCLSYKVDFFAKVCKERYFIIYRCENNFTFDAFHQLGYNRQFIEKAHFKARNIHYKQEWKDKEESICEKTRTEKLLPPKTKVVYNSTTTNKSYLRNSVAKGYPRQSGVYKVPCSYIGKSDNIDKRLQQHKNDFSNNNRNNPIVKHIIRTRSPC